MAWGSVDSWLEWVEWSHKSLAWVGTKNFDVGKKNDMGQKNGVGLNVLLFSYTL